VGRYVIGPIDNFKQRPTAITGSADEIPSDLRHVEIKRYSAASA
tara:strand:- start:2240 stop:2371 length:132 start_codon:yes stop_codon:yes gene_type:complete